MKRVCSLFFLLLFFVATPVSAQLGTNFLGTETRLAATPEFPQPGETVEIFFEYFSSQYYDANLVWRINDEVIASANNQRKVQFVAGDLGTTDTVTVTMVRGGAVVRTFTIEVVPTYVDIVIEPQTRVPDFYEGRALPSIGSQVNATALINNGRLLTGDYIYTWVLNGKVVNGGPIRGTNQVSFATPRGSRSTLILSVTDLQGNALGRRAIYVESVKPELFFYENNTLYGQSYTAISDTLLLVGTAATIIAEPYYLDINTYNNPDVNEWAIDRDVQPNTNTNPYRITIQNVEAGGTSEVSFHVRNTTELLQGVQNSIKVAY